MAIRFFDMFAGIGRFRSGLEAVSGFECIGHCEIDKYANQAYNAIYDVRGELYFEDARTINPYDLPDIDLICAGFPCQSFSVAGKRLGFADDTRGTLFFEVARIAETKRPAYLLLENVPGLLSHDGGRTLITIFSTLMSWGMISNGVCITARISESRNSEGGCTLSQVLEAEVPERYFLSPAAMRKILNKLSPDRRDKESTRQKE